MIMICKNCGWDGQFNELERGSCPMCMQTINIRSIISIKTLDFVGVNW